MPGCLVMVTRCLTDAPTPPTPPTLGYLPTHRYRRTVLVRVAPLGSLRSVFSFLSFRGFTENTLRMRCSSGTFRAHAGAGWSSRVKLGQAATIRQAFLKAVGN